MHIAGALGVPTVAVFGSGIDRQFAPLGDQHELVIAGLEPSPAPQREVASGPYDTVSDVPISQVMAAVERSLLKAVTAGPRQQQARILLNRARR
jgi:ADP-heptose:LPS heptosyltransferase